MAKGVIWQPAARAELRGIHREMALRILKDLARFLESDYGDVVQLRGMDPPEFRLRVGDYRVRFLDDGSAVTVLAVKHRREAYR
jgi:mRNA-degrading endonuclease RelE of RelBE toxin-antitoxin system